MNREIFSQNLKSHLEVAEKAAALSPLVYEAACLIIRTLRNGGKVLFCGNGGSAADAQHLAAELSGRFLVERAPLDASALHCDTSALTSISNDYGFEEVFARQVLAHGRHGDVLVAISTSGGSPNVFKAVEAAKSIGIHTIGMTGASGGALRGLTDVLINVPSASTPRIQEIHILIGHALCEMAETALHSDSQR